jgi:hypothetical protein
MNRFVPLVATLLVATAASAGRVTIVSESELGKRWSQTPESARFVAGYPAAVANKSQDVCINLGFMINEDGSTSNYTLMQAWSSATPDAEAFKRNSEPFVQNAAATVQRWHFAPTDKPHAVYTSATMAFRGGQASEEEVRAHCRIADLERFVADAVDKKRGRQTRELTRTAGGSGY